MTCAMMNEFGCGVQQAGDGCWAVPRCGYNQISNAVGDGAQDYSSSSSPSPRPSRHTSTYAIEPDASSATYFLAMAAVTGAALYPTLLRSHACALTARVPAACIVTMRACCAIDSPPPPSLLVIRRSRRCSWPAAPALLHAGRCIVLRVSVALSRCPRVVCVVGQCSVRCVW